MDVAATRRCTWLLSPHSLAVAVAMGLCGLAASAVAGEGIRCESLEGEYDSESGGVERTPHRLGESRALLAVRCRSQAGRAYWFHRIDVSVWKDGERLGEQTLFNGVTGSSGLHYEVEDEVGRVELRYDCGSRGDRGDSGTSKWCHRAWHWSSIYDRLVEVSVEAEDRKSEQYFLRQFETSLARHDYDQATGALRSIAEATGPENADWHMELNRRLLTETVRRAIEVREERGADHGSEIAARMLTASLPGVREAERYPNSAVWKLPTFAEDDTSGEPRWSTDGGAILARSEANAETVARLADLLARSDRHRRLGLRLLRSAVEAFPDRPDLRLSLADLLWELEEKADAREHYRAFRKAVRTEEGAEVPERVKERTEEE